MAEDKSTAVLLAWGNAARGDDAAGLKVLEAILQSSCDYTFQLRGIELMQLNPENAYDLQGAEVVVFMDAHSSIDQGVTFQSIHPTITDQFSSHSQTPENILALYEILSAAPPPPAYLLGIGARQFGFGNQISRGCQRNIQQGVKLLEALLGTETIEQWADYWTQFQAQTTQESADA